MIDLRKLSRDAIPAALAKADRYRLLNGAWEAESICRDVLAVEPQNHDAVVLLLLALTDQLDRRPAAIWQEASALAAGLPDKGERAYYRGLLHERRAKVNLESRDHGARRRVYDDLRQAMASYDEAAAAATAGDDSAVLRWNTCARLLNAHPSLAPAGEERLERLE